MVDRGSRREKVYGRSRPSSRLANRLGAAADMKLAEDVVEMLLDGANRDDQRVGDVAVG